MQVISILCPIDFSGFSAPANQYAISLAEKHKASIVAIIAEPTQDLDQLISENEHKNLKLGSIIKFGKHYEEICSTRNPRASRPSHYDGSGGDAVDRAVFGSTTYRVIQ